MCFSIHVRFYHKQEGENGEEEEEQEDKKWAVHSWRTPIWRHVYRLIVLPQRRLRIALVRVLHNLLALNSRKP